MFLFCLANLSYSQSRMIVTDCQRNIYPVIKIGKKYWMAENLRCTQYDTKSEMAGEIIKQDNNSLYESSYSDVRDLTTSHSGNLGSNHRSKMGLLYNWYAAVGIRNETHSQELNTSQILVYQGICPNGYHIPTTEDWDDLAKSLNNGIKKPLSKLFPTQSYYYKNIGKKLKSKSGWAEYSNGTDAIAFSALPAGCELGSATLFLGMSTRFWTSTSFDLNSAYYVALVEDSDILLCSYDLHSSKCSIRCVKD